MDDVIRIYSVTVAALVIVAGTAQIRRWFGFNQQDRLHWQATALLNLAALIGSWEALTAGYPGGVRIYLVAVGLTWLLAAVLHRPLARWRERRADQDHAALVRQDAQSGRVSLLGGASPCGRRRRSAARARP